jgi:hypothetical protein
VIEDPSCPICTSCVWRTLGARRYAQSDVERLSDYEKARYRVLFEVWFPGKEAVTLTSKSCEDCGFVTYTPRPTTEDVDRKYHFLADLGLSGPTADPDSESERRAVPVSFTPTPRAMRPRAAACVCWTLGDAMAG